MVWMAGSRSLPKDTAFASGSKHPSDQFPFVYETDTDYVSGARRNMECKDDGNG